MPQWQAVSVLTMQNCPIYLVLLCAGVTLCGFSWGVCEALQEGFLLPDQKRGSAVLEGHAG